MLRIVRILAPAVWTLCVLSAIPAVAQDQVAVPGRQVTPPQAVGPYLEVVDAQRADQVRRQFQEVLRQYPPALGQVLRLDPSLMSSPSYLATYPAVAEFIRRNPAIAKHPDFYLPRLQGAFYEGPSDPAMAIRESAMGMWRNGMEFLMILAVILTVATTLVWFVKYFVGHRRWLRATKLAVDTQTKLMERLTSSEEVLAYLQSPVGAQLLKGATIEPEPASAAPVVAPFNRILWSVQAGVVLAVAGAGLIFVKRYAFDELAVMIVTFGVLIVSVGVGFIMAAGASFVLSKRLGLFEKA